MEPAQGLSTKMDSLSLHQNIKPETSKNKLLISSSSSDIASSRTKYYNDDISKKLREFQIPPDICPHCFYTYYSAICESTNYESFVLSNEFFIASVPVYRIVLESYRKMWKRDRRPPQFSDNVFLIMFDEVKKLVRRFQKRLDWSFATSVGKMYSNLSLEWIFCCGTQPASNKSHQKPF